MTVMRALPDAGILVPFLLIAVLSTESVTDNQNLNYTIAPPVNDTSSATMPAYEQTNDIDNETDGSSDRRRRIFILKDPSKRITEFPQTRTLSSRTTRDTKFYLRNEDISQAALDEMSPHRLQHLHSIAATRDKREKWRRRKRRRRRRRKNKKSLDKSHRADGRPSSGQTELVPMRYPQHGLPRQYDNSFHSLQGDHAKHEAQHAPHKAFKTADLINQEEIQATGGKLATSNEKIGAHERHRTPEKLVTSPDRKGDVPQNHVEGDHRNVSEGERRASIFLVEKSHLKTARNKFKPSTNILMRKEMAKDDQQRISKKVYEHGKIDSKVPDVQKQTKDQMTTRHFQDVGRKYKEKQKVKLKLAQKLAPTDQGRIEKTETENEREMENDRKTIIRTNAAQLHGFYEGHPSGKKGRTNQRLIIHNETPDTNEKGSKLQMKIEPKTNRVENAKKMHPPNIHDSVHNYNRMKSLTSVGNYPTELSKDERTQSQIFANSKHGKEFLNSQHRAALQINYENSKSGKGEVFAPSSSKETSVDKKGRRPPLNSIHTPSTERFHRLDSDIQRLSKDHQQMMHRYLNLRKHWKNPMPPAKKFRPDIPDLLPYKFSSVNNENARHHYQRLLPSSHAEIHALMTKNERQMTNKAQSANLISVPRPTYTKHVGDKDQNTKNIKPPTPQTAVTIDWNQTDEELKSNYRQPLTINTNRHSLHEPPFMVYKVNAVIDPRRLFASGKTRQDIIKDRTSHTAKSTTGALGDKQSQTMPDEVRGLEHHPSKAIKGQNHHHPEADSDPVHFREGHPMLVKDSLDVDFPPNAMKQNIITSKTQDIASNDLTNKSHRQPVTLTNSDSTKLFRSHLVADNDLMNKIGNKPLAADIYLTKQSLLQSLPSTQVANQKQAPVSVVSYDTAVATGLEGQSMPVKDVEKQIHSLAEIDMADQVRNQFAENGEKRSNQLPVNHITTDQNQLEPVPNRNDHFFRQPVSITNAIPRQRQILDSIYKDSSVQLADSSTFISTTISPKSTNQDGLEIDHVLQNVDANTLQISDPINTTKTERLLSQGSAEMISFHLGNSNDSLALIRKTGLEKNITTAAKITDKHSTKSSSATTTVKSDVGSEVQKQVNSSNDMPTHQSHQVNLLNTERTPQSSTRGHHVGKHRPHVFKFLNDMYPLSGVPTGHNQSHSADKVDHEQAVMNEQTERQKLLNRGNGTMTRVIPLPFHGSSELAQLLLMNGQQGNSSTIWVVHSGIKLKPNEDYAMTLEDNFTAPQNFAFFGPDFMSHRSLVTSVGLCTTLVVFICFLCACGGTRWYRHRQYRKAFNKLEKGFSDLNTDKPFYLRLARLHRSPTGNQYVVTIINDSKFSVVEHDLESEDEVFDVMDIGMADKKGPLARLQWTNQNVPY